MARRRGRWGLTLIPALLTTIAYVDPGNFAVNAGAGVGYGYALVWVVVWASAAAALIQYLAAKLGAVTGQSLAQHCHQRSSRLGRILHWAQAELVVVMTDLAELVGGALALQLLFGVPPVLGACLVAVFSFLVLAVRRRGEASYPPVVLALLAVIVAALAALVTAVGVDGTRLAAGLRPSLPDAAAALLAVGIIGATVMPHALHFHSAVARPAPSRPSVPGREPMIGRTAISVAAAMLVAGAANVALIVVAAGAPADSAELPALHQALASVTPWAPVLFAVALLASGAAASVVSVYTGQVVLQGFWQRPLSPAVQRLIALIPSLGLLVAGLDATTALVLSQVVLAFCLPGTLLPLIRLTASRLVMGARVNRRTTTVLAATAAAVITAMDGYLLGTLVL